MHPLATWNPDRDAWEVDQGDLISGHLAVFSETWPTSGSMRNGKVYALPTSAPRTGAGGSSGLLPTPSASLASNGGSQPPGKRRHGGHSVQLHDVIEHL